MDGHSPVVCATRRAEARLPCETVGMCGALLQTSRAVLLICGDLARLACKSAR
jgi:hypothetical protein